MESQGFTSNKSNKIKMKRKYEQFIAKIVIYDADSIAPIKTI